MAQAELAVFLRLSYNESRKSESPILDLRRPGSAPGEPSQNSEGRSQKMIAATQLRPGNIIKREGELFSVFSVSHRTPGNLRGFVQAQLPNLPSRAII